MDGDGANGMVRLPSALSTMMTRCAVGARRFHTRVSLWTSCWSVTTGRRASVFCIHAMKLLKTPMIHEWSCDAAVIMWGVGRYGDPTSVKTSPVRACTHAARELRTWLTVLSCDPLEERKYFIVIDFDFFRRVTRCRGFSCLPCTYCPFCCIICLTHLCLHSPTNQQRIPIAVTISLHQIYWVFSLMLSLHRGQPTWWEIVEGRRRSSPPIHRAYWAWRGRIRHWVERIQWFGYGSFHWSRRSCAQRRSTPQSGLWAIPTGREQLQFFQGTCSQYMCTCTWLELTLVPCSWWIWRDLINPRLLIWTLSQPAHLNSLTLGSNRDWGRKLCSDRVLGGISINSYYRSSLTDNGITYHVPLRFYRIEQSSASTRCIIRIQLSFPQRIKFLLVQVFPLPRQ